MKMSALMDNVLEKKVKLVNFNFDEFRKHSENSVLWKVIMTLHAASL